jgi:hypothetical protein
MEAMVLRIRHLLGRAVLAQQQLQTTLWTDDLAYRVGEIMAC